MDFFAKTLVLLAVTIVLVFALFIVFTTKPRKKKRTHKIAYEMQVILLGFILTLHFMDLAQQGHYIWQFIYIAAGGVYISIIHIVSNMVGRYS